jgi:hypothetical protein
MWCILSKGDRGWLREYGKNLGKGTNCSVDVVIEDPRKKWVLHSSPCSRPAREPAAREKHSLQNLYPNITIRTWQWGLGAQIAPHVSQFCQQSCFFCEFSVCIQLPFFLCNSTVICIIHYDNHSFYIYTIYTPYTHI